jgi:hypothetical protein
LAKFLQKDLPPELRLKGEGAAQMESLCQTRQQPLSQELLHEEVVDRIGQGDHRHGPQVSGDHLQEAED